jgi:Tfp pilus assembly protein PilF
VKYVVLLLFVALVLCGCSSSNRPPGQTVASENHFENGVKQYEKGHIKQAIHQFEKAVQKDPTNYRAYYFLGLCYKERHAKKTALKYLQKAIDLNPDDELWVAKVNVEMEPIAPKKGKKK